MDWKDNKTQWLQEELRELTHLKKFGFSYGDESWSEVMMLNMVDIIGSYNQLEELILGIKSFVPSFENPFEQVM